MYYANFYLISLYFRQSITKLIQHRGVLLGFIYLAPKIYKQKGTCCFHHQSGVRMWLHYIGWLQRRGHSDLWEGGEADRTQYRPIRSANRKVQKNYPIINCPGQHQELDGKNHIHTEIQKMLQKPSLFLRGAVNK
jgi:hypothetical protein